MSWANPETFEELNGYIKNPLRLIEGNYFASQRDIASTLGLIGVTNEDLSGLCNSFYKSFSKETKHFIGEYYEFRKIGTVPKWAVAAGKELEISPESVFHGFVSLEYFPCFENEVFPFSPEVEKAFYFVVYHQKLSEYIESLEDDDNKFQKLKFFSTFIKNKNLPNWASKVLCVYLYGFVGIERIHDYSILGVYFQNAVPNVDYPYSYKIVGECGIRLPSQAELIAWKPNFVVRKKRMEEDIEKMTIVREAKNQQCKNRTDLYLCVMDLAEKKTGKEISYQTAMNWAKAYEKQGYKLFES